MDVHSGIFKAYDIRGVYPTELNEDVAYLIGRAFAVFIGGERVVVGRDMRVSSPRMAAAFIDGALSRGADVVDIGLASTDQLWFASGRLGLPGAMFTASHNPKEYNGVKFCLAGAQPIAPAQLVEIADRAEAGAPASAARGERSEQDLLPAYADHLHSLVDLSGIRQLTVVADAGHESRKLAGQLKRHDGFTLQIVTRRQRAFRITGLTWIVERSIAWINRVASATP